MELKYMILIAIFIMICLHLIITAKKHGKKAALEEARRIALRLMLTVDKRYGTNNGTGSVKMDWVADRVMPLLPPIISATLITRSDLINFLEETYQLGKDYLDDGKINNSPKRL